MSQSKTPAPLCQTLHQVVRKARCWAEYFFFCTSMTCIDPQPCCALFILLKVFASDSDINNVHASVNRELVGVDNWLKINRLTLNVSKTSYIISNKKNALDIQIRETILKKVSTVKFLGVTLDENLVFKDHVNKVTSNISKSVGVMRRLHCQQPANVMVKLYYSLVYSHLTYALLPNYWHGEDREVLMLLRLGVLTGEHVNYPQIITKRFSLFTQFMILCFIKSFQHKYP